MEAAPRQVGDDAQGSRLVDEVHQTGLKPPSLLEAK